MSGILRLQMFLSFCLYGYGFLSLGFTDRREILHDGSPTSQTGFSHFGWDSPRDGRIMGVNVSIRSILGALKQPINRK